MKSKTLFLMILNANVVYAKPDTMIVFDASAPMWVYIDGKTKIEIARDAMAEIGQGFDANQAVRTQCPGGAHDYGTVKS